MDMVSPIMDILTQLWHCTAKITASIRDLGENIRSLREISGTLDNTITEVEGQVAQVDEYYVILNHVRVWLDEAKLVRREAGNILQQGDEEIQNKCLGSCCPRNCRTTYRLSKTVIEKIQAVNRLIADGDFSVVAGGRRPVIPGTGDEQPEEKFVEIEPKVQEVWELIENPSVGIIGLCGMGGVGKTRLLHELYVKFTQPINQHLQILAIWVTVPKEFNVNDIQDFVASKLEIPDDIWKSLDEPRRATKIHNRLERIYFALFLDDLWVHIDLLKVGIPMPNDQNGSKIILTTRSEEVCMRMGARVYEVQCLSREAALELFRQKVTEDVYSLPGIAQLAKTVMEECKGLPLALITIGSAMTSRRTPEEWQHAINMMQNYPSELFTDMGKDILSVLKFSYDSLGDDMLKACFLYCSVFPEDHKIRKDELIELWIAEGFFEHYGTLDEARNRGEYIISSLKHVSLLESVEDSEVYVKMHDVLRDMALHLASEEGKEILVYEDDGRLSVSKWKKAVRISLWGSKFQNISKIPYSPDLLTFLVRNTRLSTFPDAFFQSMRLKVLDLQGNYFLNEFPQEMSRLINLEYLNLSESSIEELPDEVRNLTKLRILLLNGTCKLESIPEGVISSLSSLQVFSRLPTRRNWLPFQRFWDTTLLAELERLEDIREIGLTLFTINSVHQFRSSKLQSFVKRLIVNCLELPSLDIS